VIAFTQYGEESLTPGELKTRKSEVSATAKKTNKKRLLRAGATLPTEVAATKGEITNP
jgi:hypothetical protein